MKILRIDLERCEATTDQSCSLCDIRHPGLREKIKNKGEVVVSKWAEDEIVSKLIDDCPCSAITLVSQYDKRFLDMVDENTMTERQKRIQEHRRSKPISELERKWNKSKGRHSNQFWTEECLDLVLARTEILYKDLFSD